MGDMCVRMRNWREAASVPWARERVLYGDAQK